MIFAKGEFSKLFKASTVSQAIRRDYRSEYFDHKIHYNQNKKLRIHTTVHVCARVLLYDLRVRNHGNKKLFNNK